VLAVETALLPFGLVPAEILEKGRDLRLASRHPEKAEQLKWISGARTIALDFINAVRVAL